MRANRDVDPSSSSAREWLKGAMMLSALCVLVAGGLWLAIGGGVVGWVLVCGAVFGAGIGLMILGVRLRPLETRNGVRVGEIIIDSGIALATGAVIGLALFGATWSLERSLVDAQRTIDDLRSERDTQLENTRFVRSAAMQPGSTIKPFAGLDLRGADLNGLDLSDADLRGADLRGASLSGTNLHCAWMDDVDLTGAYLGDADLSQAALGFAILVDVDAGSFFRVDTEEGNLALANVPADMRGASLGGATMERWSGTVSFQGTDLRFAEIEGLEASDDRFDIIYDDETQWPDGFEPSPKHSVNLAWPTSNDEELCDYQVKGNLIQEGIDSGQFGPVSTGADPHSGTTEPSNGSP